MSIEIRNLSHIYMKGTAYEKLALKNINLKINKGEFVGIIGHTGSGKTTLVQHLNGLMKPNEGSIIIDNIDVKGKNLKELRNKIGIVFQYPEHQLFEETVYKDIEFGLKNQGIDNLEIEKRIHEAIEIVGLDKEVLYMSPFELSGGQKRRAAIAGVLVMHPSILILDEPTAGLDPEGRDEIYGFIKHLHKERQITIILVSHSMEDVARMVQKVIVMNNGEIEMYGDTNEIFKRIDRLEQIGLGAPQITYLMKEISKSVPEIKSNIYTIEEAKIELIKYLRMSQ